MPPESILKELRTTARVLERIASLLAETLSDRIRRWAASRSGRRLRVGIDVRPFYEPLTGVGWYLYHLLHELERSGEVDLVGFGDARIEDRGPRLHADLPLSMRLLTFDLRGLPEVRAGRLLTAGAYLALIRLTGCDLIFGANYFLPRLMSAVARKRVITIHDLTWRRHPELVQKETLHNLERTMSWEIFNADAILCVSEATRNDVLRFYETDASKVIAVHSGIQVSDAAQPGSAAPRHLPKGPYLLFVGTIEPRKDLDTLLTAFERLKDQRRYDGSLVVVGRVGWKSEATLRRLQTSRWRGSIHHLDYIEPSALASVYSGADIFVFPSLHEGFGFPLLEAMVHGIPPIATTSSSLPEVGGDAALYFEPGNAGELARQIERLASDPALRSALIEKGRRRLAEFPWSRTARKTLEVFRRVADR